MTIMHYRSDLDIWLESCTIFNPRLEVSSSSQQLTLKLSNLIKFSAMVLRNLSNYECGIKLGGLPRASSVRTCSGSVHCSLLLWYPNIQSVQKLLLALPRLSYYLSLAAVVLFANLFFLVHLPCLVHHVCFTLHFYGIAPTHL